MKADWSHEGPKYDALHAFLEGRTGHKLPRGTIMASVHGGLLRGAVLFNGYHEKYGIIELTAASVTSKWLSRKVLTEMFEFPFGQLGCQAVVMRSAPENTRVARIAKAFGFEKYEIPRLRGRDKSEIVFVLTDDAWTGNGFHRKAS